MRVKTKHGGFAARAALRYVVKASARACVCVYSGSFHSSTTSSASDKKPLRYLSLLHKSKKAVCPYEKERKTKKEHLLPAMQLGQITSCVNDIHYASTSLHKVKNDRILTKAKQIS
jgi:hypothetical protein